MRDPSPNPPATPTTPLPPRNGPGRGRKIVRFALFFLTVVVLVDAIVGENGVLALLQARRTYAAVERALQQSRDDNAALRETARRLREDPSAIEAIGLCGPRMPSGASGFMSNMSR